MALTTEDTIISPQFENTPEELKARPQWVLWKAEERDGKLTKIPYNCKGSKASTTAKDTWSSFDEVVATYKFGGYNGIGFVLSKEDPYIVIDVDSVDLMDLSNEDKLLASMSYSECSPSKKGFHVWIKGDLPQWTKHRVAHREIYEQGRYMTFTGATILNKPIQTFKPKQMENLLTKYNFSKENEKTSSAPLPKLGVEQDDATVLQNMFTSKNGLNIKALYEGDLSCYGNDASRADQALCNHLIFWTKGNVQQTDRLFRLSALMRSKWDEKRGDMTYGELTIQSALSTTFGIPKPREGQMGFFENNRFFSARLAKIIMSNYHIIYDNGFYLYENGVYRKTDSTFIKQECIRLLGDEYSKRRVEEVVYYIENQSAQSVEKNNNKEKYINLKNGLLDWRTKELHSHTPDYISTIQIPVEYNPNAKCPNIEKFMSEVVPADAIQTMFEWFGYCLLPITRYEKALMLTGEGSNGKSKFIELLEAFIGKENATNIPLQDLEHDRFASARLKDKLLNTFADIPSNALEKASIFKTLVSGDSISGQLKFKDSFEFTPFAKLVFSANELPRSADLTDGFFRRWLIIPFPHKFGKGGKKADPKLSEKLIQSTELSGLLNIAITHLKELEEQGCFTINSTTQEAVETYKKEIDNVALFVEEMCEIGADRSAIKTKLLQAYTQWCYEGNYKPLGRTKFYHRLEKIAPIIKKRSTEGTYKYDGISIEYS